VTLTPEQVIELSGRTATISYEEDKSRGPWFIVLHSIPRATGRDSVTLVGRGITLEAAILKSGLIRTKKRGKRR
jgi:hypothetical protein